MVNATGKTILDAKVVMAATAYSVCSSSLLLANKTALLYLPRPALINFTQIIFSLVVLFGMKLCGADIDKLEWNKARHYIIYVCAFTISRFANMKALQNANVETVIVFRACAPLAVSIVEYLFMGRSFPSARSCTSLVLVCIGASLYCHSDSEFSVRGISAYSWVSIYFILLLFEMTYCKALTSSAKMNSKWGPVFYCNFLAAFPTAAIAYFADDFSNFSYHFSSLSTTGYVVLLFSCIGGTFIG